MQLRNGRCARVSSRELRRRTREGPIRANCKRRRRKRELLSRDLKRSPSPSTSTEEVQSDLEEVTVEKAGSPFSTIKSMLCDEDIVSDKSWLTSTFIDLVLFKFAMVYPSVQFLPTDFVPLHLESAARNNGLGAGFDVYDILGRKIKYHDKTSIVFVANVGLIHWNLFRLQHEPHPELQLFEPMGRPASRNGVSARYVPRTIITWLDQCFPQPESWQRRTVSAITKQHQYSGFDCGVACLLYAEKCGKGQIRQEINDLTDQFDITCFRKELQLQLAAHYQSTQTTAG